MRTLLTALFMTLATQVFADATQEKLDQVLEKLTSLESRMNEMFDGAEAMRSLFTSDLFGSETEQSTDQQTNLDDLLNDITGGEDTSITEQPPTDNAFITVVDWSANDGGSSLAALGKVIKIEVTIKNVSRNTISIIDGAYDVKDKLGEDIMRFKIDNDLNLEPGATYVQSGAYDAGMQFGGDMKRLLTINPKLVSFDLDIEQILFENGEVLKF